MEGNVRQNCWRTWNWHTQTFQTLMGQSSYMTESQHQQTYFWNVWANIISDHLLELKFLSDTLFRHWYMSFWIKSWWVSSIKFHLPSDINFHLCTMVLPNSLVWLPDSIFTQFQIDELVNVDQLHDLQALF